MPLYVIVETALELRWQMSFHWTEELAEDQQELMAVEMMAATEVVERFVVPNETVFGTQAVVLAEPVVLAEAVVFGEAVAQMALKKVNQRFDVEVLG